MNDTDCCGRFLLRLVTILLALAGILNGGIGAASTCLDRVPDPRKLARVDPAFAKADDMARFALTLPTGLREAQWRGVASQARQEGDAFLAGFAYVALGELIWKERPAEALSSLSEPEIFTDPALAGPALDRALRILESTPNLLVLASAPLKKAALGGCGVPSSGRRLFGITLAAGRTEEAAAILTVLSVSRKEENWIPLARVRLALAQGDQEGVRPLFRAAFASPGCFDETFTLARDVLGEDPLPRLFDETARVDLAAALLARGENRQAFQTVAGLVTAAEAWPTGDRRRLTVASAALAAGGAASAARLASSYIATGDSDLFEKARILAYSGRRIPSSSLQTENLALLERLGPHTPTRLQLLSALAFDAEVEGESDRSRDLYLQIANAAAPGSEQAAEARWKLGWIAYLGGKWEEAARFFAEGFRDDPGKEFGVACLYWQGVCLGRLGRSSEARARYQALHSFAPMGYYGVLSERRLATMEPASVAGKESAEWVAALRKKYFPDLPQGTTDPAEIRLIATAQALGRPDFGRLALGQNGWTNARHLLAAAAARQEGETFALLFHVHRACPELYTIPGEDIPTDWRESLFPFPYGAEVEENLTGVGADSLLVHSLIRQESAFKADIRSVSNAIGLMQILPSTAAEEAHLPNGFELERRLEHPCFNLRLGCGYLEKLIRMLEGHVPLALASYNGGPTRILKLWKRYGGWEGPEELVDLIPMAQSRTYVKNIFRNYNYYCLYRKGRQADPARFFEPVAKAPAIR